MLTTFVRYFHTIKYLKPIQLYGQILARIKKQKKIPDHPPPRLRPMIQPWVPAPEKQDRLLDASHVECLNQCENIESSTIWFDENKSRLWLYHLHYFHYLHANQTVSPSSELILRWIKENPPTVRPAWEPYPISLRVVNWIKWLIRNEGEDIHDEALNAVHRSLTQQIYYLSHHLETHILANHYFANAKALIFAGLYFAADGWLELGLKIFNRQLKEQILEDGGHFELSPMYHAIILEDILDVINLCHVYQHKMRLRWISIARQMLHWLQAMSHPDGEFAFFNDTALNVAPRYAQLYDYAKRLNILKENDRRIIDNTNLMNASGYHRLVHGDMILLADMAPLGAHYQPGHAHADTLSFELSVNGKRLLVNSGISTYVDNAKRLAERSTHTHNTLIINDKNSSDVWKSFRVAKRAHVFDLTARADKLQASHDGYYSNFKIMHRRTWQFDQHQLTLCDELISPRTTMRSSIHNIKIVFHVHPDIAVIPLSEYEFLFESQGKPIATLTTELGAKLLASTYHPGFNITLVNQKILMEVNTRLPITIKTVIKSENPCTYYS